MTRPVHAATPTSPSPPPPPLWTRLLSRSAGGRYTNINRAAHFAVFNKLTVCVYPTLEGKGLATTLRGWLTSLTSLYDSLNLFLDLSVYLAR